MKAAFLTSSLIASKGKAAPASPRLTPRNLLDEDANTGENRVSRIYQRVREYADPHPDADGSHDDVSYDADHAADAAETSSNGFYSEESKSDDTDDTNVNGFNGASYVPSAAYSAPTSAAMNGAESAAEDLPPLGEEKAQEIADEVAKLKKDGLGRIRISVRMSPKDHLQLKLIAAHTQMSAQSIFETALEEYIANHGTEILPRSCACVLDKSSL